MTAARAGLATWAALALAVLYPGCDRALCNDYAEDVGECVDEHCAGDGAGSPVCLCWENGQDIDVETCTCRALDLEATCEGYDLSGYDAGDFACEPFVDALAGVCPA